VPQQKQGLPQSPLWLNHRAIVVKAGKFVGIARKEEELKNRWTDKRDRAGRIGIARRQSKRIHGSHYGFLFVSAIQMMRAKMVTQ
jgi:hypothetical protein